MCRRASSCLRWTIHPGAWSRPRGASGSGVDRSGLEALVHLFLGDQAVLELLPQPGAQVVVLVLGPGHLDLVLVEEGPDVHLGVEVARRGDGEVALGDLDALVTVVLDHALQGVVPVVAAPDGSWGRAGARKLRKRGGGGGGARSGRRRVHERQSARRAAAFARSGQGDSAR